VAIAVKKEKMTAALDVSPFEEMSRDSEAWCRKNPVLRGRMKNYAVAHTVKLDPRKWNEKILRKALKSLVRYELKLFDVKVGDIIKDAKEAGLKGEIEAQPKVLKLYDKIGKEIEKKVSLALEEIEEDKGDNAKGLREGKKAMKAMASVDFKKLFTGPGDKAQAALDALSRSLGRAGDDDAARDKAMDAADRALDVAITEFDKGRDAAEAAIILLQKTARKIVKNDAAGPELVAFGKEIEDANGVCEAMIDAIHTYSGELIDAMNAIRGDKLDQMKARKLAADLGATSRFTSSADKMKNMLAKLQKSFAKVQQALK